MQNIIECRNLNKVYVMGATEQQVLKNIDINIKKGEFVSVMGPSGSGKSTLLHVISGMDKATSGSVIFNGQEMSRLSETDLSKLRLEYMGFIFQQFYLLKNLCILDNIILSAYLAGKISRNEINKYALDLMEKTGISQLAKNDITQASGGQLQRACICRALINKPAIIFGDEPTGALNSKSSSEIMEILQDIHKSGTTILLVTHDIKVAAKTERILFMADGNILGEQHLETYVSEDNNLKIREERLAKWLLEMGF